MVLPVLLSARALSRPNTVSCAACFAVVPPASRPLELAGELVVIVCDELGGIPRVGYRNMECGLVGQLSIAGRHRRENPVHRPALKGVHSGRERAVDMSELGSRGPSFITEPFSRQNRTPSRSMDSAVAALPFLSPLRK